MDGSSNEQYLKAKGYALRLFKLRPQSSGELIVKLRGKGYPDEIINRLIAEMLSSGYINDAAFARAWLQGRWKRYGYRRLAIELGQKGLPRELIESAWNQVKDGCDEEAVVKDIASRRARLYKDVPFLKRKKRVMDYLARRGFNMGIINKVLREL